MEDRARELFRAKRYKEAAGLYKQLAQATPTQPKWYTNGAKCFYQLEKDAKAKKLCQQATAVDPTWEPAYTCHAQVLTRAGALPASVQVPNVPFR